MASLKMQKLWGRVDLIYERRAAEIIDRRGEIAQDAVAYDGAFFQYTITDDGAIVQSVLTEVQINSAFASCIWRDEHKRSGLLDFIEKQILPTRRLKGIRFYAIYAKPSVLKLEEMIQSMRSGTDWDGFGLNDRGEIADVGIVYTIKRGGTAPFTATCGPMGEDQLKNAVYGTLASHMTEQMVAPVWFLNLTENAVSPLPEGTTIRTVKAVIAERFNLWNDFAHEFLRGEDR